MATTRPRLVALDLDGTLLDSQQRISDRSRRAIRALDAQGTRVVLCTGRPPRMTDAYVRQLELDEAIVFNGAGVYRASAQSTRHHHQLTADNATGVLATIRRELPDAGIGLETHHGWYLDAALYAAAKARLDAAGLPHPDGVGSVEDFVRDAVIKIFVRHPHLPAPDMWRAMGDAPVYATWSGAGMLEMMHPRVNKRDALERMAADLGLHSEAVAVFGDQNNDIEMLRWAGLGVATANASEDARAAADEVTATNDEDGVAQVLERWIAPGEQAG